MKISQCMIVKNEAHNLEKSLGNLKDVVFEQIVVDTGSTDNTVEVAETLGAKVFHFEWINDFAAAKNYAIDKASGDWILFLDADEYIEKDKAEYLITMINEAKKRKSTIVRLEMFHLDDNGKVFLKGVQDRLFINRKDIRYHGKIHENLKSKRNDFKYLLINDVPIWHTGYKPEVVKEKEKGQRNIDLLKNEIEKDSSNPQLYNYLADAILLNGTSEEALDSFKTAYRLLSKLARANKITYLHTIHGMLKLLIDKKELLNEAVAFFEEATQRYPDDADLYFYMGQIYREQGNINQSIDLFEKCVSLSVNEKGSAFNATLGKLYELNRILLELYCYTKDWQKAVKKAVLLVGYNRFDTFVTHKLIEILRTSESDVDIFAFLGKLYDMTQLKDRVYMLKIFNLCNSKELRELIISYFTDSEKEEYAIDFSN